MTDHAPILRRLVALKRQKAEQQVLSLQQELERIETSITALSSGLQAMDSPELGFPIRALAARQGHVEKLIAELAVQQVSMAKTETELGVARDALKRVFHSQDRLQRMAEA